MEIDARYIGIDRTLRYYAGADQGTRKTTGPVFARREALGPTNGAYVARAHGNLPRGRATRGTDKRHGQTAIPI